MEFNQFIKDMIEDDIWEAILSNPFNKDQAFKVKLRKIIMKDGVEWQESRYLGSQVFHNNLKKVELEERLASLMKEQFRQAQLETKNYRGTVLVSKKGTITIKKKRKTGNELEEKPIMTHNREKNYILKEGEPIDFLVALGVMTKEGKVTKARYDKFRQINRYLEFISDVLPALPEEKVLRIIDFGCGKSYLTFAVYYFLHIHMKRKVEMIGLDLKEDVIKNCNDLAIQLDYKHLQFLKGDIAGFQDKDGADMVITLHACDTATDYAIYKAVKWNASVILSVPCCQHEVNKQIDVSKQEGLLRYGILKEKMSALITDGIRAELLEEQGYETQVLEFIDIENTPKNLLIRAVKRKGMKPSRRMGSGLEIAEFWGVHTTLQKLFDTDRSE